MPVTVVAGAESPLNATVLWQAIKPTMVGNAGTAGYPSVNLTDPATWSSWKPVGSNAGVGYDMGAPVSFDGCGISAHNMATSGVAGVRIQYSLDNSTWSTIVTPETLTDDDMLILFPAVTARYWRITLNGPPANVGVLVFGKRLVFPHAPVDGYTPLHHARQYTKLFNDSVKGQFLGNRVMAAGAETSVDMGFLERPWLEGNIRPFEAHYNQGGTFFYAGCPGKYPLDMGYCRAGGDDETLAIEWNEADKMANLSFGIRSYVG